MTEPIVVETEFVSEETAEERANSRKREITAAVVAGAVTVLLGAASSGIISRIGDSVKNRIAPKPEKPEIV